MSTKTYLISCLISVSILGGGLIHYYTSPKPQTQSSQSETKSGIVQNTQNEPKKPTPTPDVAKPIKLLFVGDTMLARSIGDQILKGRDPFENLKSTFLDYDLVIANLETTIGSSGQPAEGKLYTFQAPVKSAQTLKNAGVEVVSLANNHTMDYGFTGLNQTMKALDNQDVKYYGAGKNTVEAFKVLEINLKDQTIGLLGINDIENYYTNTSASSSGSAFYDIPNIARSIDKVKDKNGILIATPHWGTEYQQSANNRQKTIAKSLISAGVDIVIGGHAHVVQNKEIIEGKEVYYSMGNFVFDQMGGQAGATKGQMIEVVILDNQIKSSRAIDITIDSNGFPNLAN
jgi:poly-gamma-glutamate capsule biosynthesis protein CapA/YwtB (metallophosphatase superfamily)